MRNGQNGRRRGRGNNPGGGGISRPNMNGGARPDSNNRMEVRARGNAHQLLEKYKTLARDAHQAGDRVAAEYYMQHADHYYRVLSEGRPRQEDGRGRQTNFMDDPDPETEFDGDEDGGAEFADGGNNAQNGNRGGQQPERNRQDDGERRERYDNGRADNRYENRRDEGRGARGNDQGYADNRGARGNDQGYADNGGGRGNNQAYADVEAPRGDEQRTDVTRLERAPEPAQTVTPAASDGAEEPPRRRRGRPPRARPATNDEDGGDIGLPDFITLDG